MKSETSHSMLPWKQHQTEGKTFACIRSANNETLADCGSRSDKQAQANAAFIVKACNSHDALVEALQFVRKYAAMQMQKGKPLPGQLMASVSHAIEKATGSLLTA